jgi:hypothetical protein
VVEESSSVITNSFETSLSLQAKLSCGHENVIKLVCRHVLNLASSTLQLNNELLRVSSSASSWNIALSHMFQPLRHYLFWGAVGCSLCGLSTENKISSQFRRIHQINESLTLTLPRGHHDLTTTPLVILPILDLIPYCEPALVQDLIIKRRMRYASLLDETLSTTLSINNNNNNNNNNNIPSVLIEIILEYIVAPAQYSLDAIDIQHESNGSKSIIIKKSKTLTDEDDWWFISGITDVDPIRIKSEDIFTTDHSTTIVSSSDCPLPLTHAVALRYQLVI